MTGSARGNWGKLTAVNRCKEYREVSGQVPRSWLVSGF